MIRGEGACLVCGKPLMYFEEAKVLTCSYCGKPFASNASCEDGHYVCDQCHGTQGVQAVLAYCLHSDSRNPIAMLQDMMEHPLIHMHGPEHHIMVGAALITAYRNSGGAVELPAALEKMRQRGSQYPGGACGLWGCCGAAVSAGMAVSIITGATPLATLPWHHANETTSRCLHAIAELGGPRCCKRNAFTAAKVAAQYISQALNVTMELPESICCDYSAENRQCRRNACPYYAG